MMFKTLVRVYICLALFINSGRCLSIDVTKMSTQVTNQMNDILGVRFVQVSISCYFNGKCSIGILRSGLHLYSNYNYLIAFMRF